MSGALTLEAPSRPDFGGGCVCCKPVASPKLLPSTRSDAMSWEDRTQTFLRVNGSPTDVARTVLATAPLEEFERALDWFFDGPFGLQAVFGCPNAKGARRVKYGGLNHVFMVALGGRLAKCIQPRSFESSEAKEAWRLRIEAPSLVQDSHAVFPTAAFLCCAAEERISSGHPPCEILVFEHLEGCRTLSDLICMFEQTHPHGLLQQCAACPDYAACGYCPHLSCLQALVSRQVPALGRRFQLLHGRRHGDFKVDNVLLERCGRPRVIDFLSPFCSSCDRNEFVSSTCTLHPQVKDMRSAANRAWLLAGSEGAPQGQDVIRELGAQDLACNAGLIASLDRLWEEKRSRPLFGNIPSLLEKIGIPSFPSIGSRASASGSFLPRQLEANGQRDRRVSANPVMFHEQRIEGITASQESAGSVRAGAANATAVSVADTSSAYSFTCGTLSLQQDPTFVALGAHGYDVLAAPIVRQQSIQDRRLIDSQQSSTQLARVVAQASSQLSIKADSIVASSPLMVSEAMGSCRDMHVCRMPSIGSDRGFTPLLGSPNCGEQPIETQQEEVSRCSYRGQHQPSGVLRPLQLTEPQLFVQTIPPQAAPHASLHCPSPAAWSPSGTSAPPVQQPPTGGIFKFNLKAACLAPRSFVFRPPQQFKILANRNAHSGVHSPLPVVYAAA